MKTSLGLLEVAGLALAIKAADSMVKAAGVEITGIERTNGSGWMLVSVTGDVASVNTAIADGAALARLERGWVADRVIARPAAALDSWIALHGASTAFAAEPVGTGTGDAVQTKTRLISAPDAAESAPASSGSKKTASPAVADGASDAEPAHPVNGADYTEPVFASALNAVAAAGCNLCHDPACTRRKGEPRGACIHYAQRGNV